MVGQSPVQKIELEMEQVFMAICKTRGASIDTAMAHGITRGTIAMRWDVVAVDGFEVARWNHTVDQIEYDLIALQDIPDMDFRTITRHLNHMRANDRYCGRGISPNDACIERSAVREQFGSTIKEFIDEILQHRSIEHNSDLANRFAEAGVTPMVLAAVPKHDLLHQFSLPGNIATIGQVADIISLQQAALIQKRPPSEFCRSPPPSRVKRKRKCIRKHRLPVGRGRGSVKGIWGLRRRICSFWQRVAAEGL